MLMLVFIMAALRYFPYSLREHQREVIEFIEKGVREKVNVCIHAATGFGKTPVILAALLPYVVGGGRRIIWAVRTGNETDRPIEELKEIVERKKIRVFGLSFRGKRDMCLLARELKIQDYTGVSVLCRKKRKECPYYQNVYLVNSLLKQPLLFSEIYEFAKETDMCPYFLQMELLRYAKVVSLSYNYIISELGWTINRLVPFRNSFLVVDEAHNLQYAASSINSDRITIGSVKRAIGELNSFKSDKVTILKGKLKDLMKVLESEGRKINGEDDVFDPKMVLESSDINVKELELLVRYGSLIHSRQLKEGKAPRSSLFHLGRFWLAALESLNIDGIAFLKFRENGNFVFEIWDMRAAELLKDKWNKFRLCIFCSGTLKPIKAFSETIGLTNYDGKIVPSFADPSKIVTLVPEELTTRGEELEKEMVDKYLEAIKLFLECMNSNAAVFCASYRIQEDILPGLSDICRKLGREIFVEKQGMSGDEARKILDDFKIAGKIGNAAVLCATMTGRFAEGADFPGKELEGVFLVGIPFDRVTMRTKLYIDYYSKLYGEEKGRYYAYVVPAFRRASQALGRVIRSKDDRGIFICGDKRYSDPKYLHLLPDYIQKTMIKVKVADIRKKIQSSSCYC